MFFIILVRVEYSVHELLCAYSDLPIINPIFGIFPGILRVQNFGLFMV
jgi:hypothetical protein